MVTIAAINGMNLELPIASIVFKIHNYFFFVKGHCFAGGVLLSLCHDYRVMQGGRGWFCMNEVDLGEIFQPYMIKLLE